MRAPITDKHLLEMMWERFPEIMKRGIEQPAQQEPVRPCTHPSLGACSLREDGTASRWNCVMCGTEFVPKATQRWAEFNETTKRNIEHAKWYLSTHPQPAQQEPVDSTQVSKVWWDGEKLMAKPIPFVEFYKPAQRTWVGLTPEELDEMFSKTLKGKKLVNWIARAVEAKLKEKNT